MAELNFAEKRVLVVGGTSGINRGIAEAFAREGAHVAVVSRKQAKVDDTLAALRKAGASAVHGFAADVRDAAALAEGVAELHKLWGELDVVVSGAAGNFPALASTMSANAFKSVIDIDLLGTFHVMKAVYPFLKKPGASIINISAPQAVLPMLAQSHVSAAKAGVDMITRSLAVEWGGEGIRLNSIIPGPIDGTEGMARLAPGDHLRKAVVDSVPLGRMGSPQDIANACLFLASDLATYITGAILPVDGGWVQGGVAVVGSTLGDVIEKSQRDSASISD